MDVQKALDLCESAGIPLSDVCQIIQVSRTTLSRWKNDKQPPTDTLRINAVLALGTRVQAAIDKNRLPLATRITKQRERIAVIKRILKECSSEN